MGRTQVASLPSAQTSQLRLGVPRHCQPPRSPRELKKSSVLLGPDPWVILGTPHSRSTRVCAISPPAHPPVHAHHLSLVDLPWAPLPSPALLFPSGRCPILLGALPADPTYNASSPSLCPGMALPHTLLPQGLCTCMVLPAHTQAHSFSLAKSCLVHRPQLPVPLRILHRPVHVLNQDHLVVLPATASTCTGPGLQSRMSGC